MKFKLLILIWFLFSAFQISLANFNDCEELPNNIQKMPIYWQYKNIFPDDAIRQSYKNLRSYCCKNHLIKEDIDYDFLCKESDQNENIFYPESSSLFDHLFDVSMRRLDWFALLDYNLPLDPVADARRNWNWTWDGITKIAESADGNTSLNIMDRYTKFWKTNTNNILFQYLWSDSNFKIIYWKNVTLSDYNDKYNIINSDWWPAVSLTDKYNNLCQIIIQLYYTLTDGNKDRLIIDTSSNNGYYNACANMTNQRIQKEYVYVQTISISKSTKLLIDTMEAYFNKNFVQNRLVGLQSKISSLSNLFSTIVKQAPTAKQCNK